MQPGIIFDLDGTLIDSIGVHKQALRGILARYKVTVSDEDFSRINGKSAKEGLKQLLREKNISILRLWWVLFQKHAIKKRIMAGIKVFEGTTHALEQLKDYPKAVASSSHQTYVKESLARFELGQHFVAALSCDDVKHSKPAPDIFLKAASQLGKQPGMCVVVEDAINGVKAARAAGMRVIAVLTSTPKEQFENQAPADAYLAHIGELDEEVLRRVTEEAYETPVLHEVTAPTR